MSPRTLHAGDRFLVRDYPRSQAVTLTDLHSALLHVYRRRDAETLREGLAKLREALGNVGTDLKLGELYDECHPPAGNLDSSF
jgi:hypothetical protein